MSWVRVKVGVRVSKVSKIDAPCGLGSVVE